MKRIKYIIIIALSFLMASCGGTKKVTTANNDHSNSLYKKNLSEKQNLELQYIFFNANKEKILGNYEKARELFEVCVKMDPDNAASYFELALIYETQGNDEMAFRAAQKASQIDPDNDWYMTVLAGMHENMKQFSEAAKIYEKLVQKNPGNFDNYYYWTNCLIYSNDLRGAIRVYDLLEEKTGISEELSLQKEKIYLELKDLDGAIREIETLVNTNPGENKYLNILGELYQKTGNSEKALAIYNKLIETDPNNAYVHLSLSDYYKSLGNEEKAKEELILAFENPNLGIDSKVHILLNYFTLSGIKEGKTEEALFLGNVLVNTHPEEAKARSIYGDLLYRVDSLHAAREQYRKAVEQDESKFVLWSQILIIGSQLNDNKSMYEEATKAVELFPSQPSFYLFKGMAAAQLKEHEIAIEALTTGKELVFDNPPLLAQFYSSLGDVYNKIENHPASDSAYEKSLEYEPNNIYVLNNYSYYLSLRKENLAKAEKMSKKSNELEPRSSSFADTYGWILFQMGEYESAKTWMENAMEYGGKNSGVILEHYGDVLYKLGETERAKEYWQKASDTKQGSGLLQQKIESGHLIE